MMRDQDSVACLIRNFYPKELHVSLASPGAFITAQTLTVIPLANGTYGGVQIGRVGENDTIPCSVKHLGKEIRVFHWPGMINLWLMEIGGMEVENRNASV